MRKDKNMDKERYAELFEKAKGMLEMSYAPFSDFHVGAALLCEDGSVYTGCNIENSSLGATICAERTAFVKAISEGHRKFEAIVLTSHQGAVLPCGICRQFMQEFCGEDFKIITGDDAEHLKTYTLGQILPGGFNL